VSTFGIIGLVSGLVIFGAMALALVAVAAILDTEE
jgi:hypothetical protein